MRTIIAGSRTITDYTILQNALVHVKWEITEVLSGTCKGADLLGERYAKENGMIPKRFPADWQAHSKQAGYLRNVEMAENADACIVLWDGQSKGAKMMMQIARRHELEMLVYEKDTFQGREFWRPVKHPAIPDNAFVEHRPTRAHRVSQDQKALDRWKAG